MYRRQKSVSSVLTLLLVIGSGDLSFQFKTFGLQPRGSAASTKHLRLSFNKQTNRVASGSRRSLVRGIHRADESNSEKDRLSEGLKQKKKNKRSTKKKSTKKNKSRSGKKMDGGKRKKQKRNDIIDLTESDEEERKPATVIEINDPEPGVQLNFALCSYNVWFGPPHPFERMNAICEAIASESPLFVGLQEVTSELSQMLFPLLESVGYQTVVQDMTGIGYGCAVAIKEDACTVIASGFHPYRDTIMGRGIVWVVAKFEGGVREVLFTTTHLESFVQNHPSPGQIYDGGEQRELQVKQLNSFCQDCMNKRASVDLAVITGDLNWDDQRKRSLNTDKPLLEVLGGDWSDAWLETRPGQEGYTYDSKESAMLRGNVRHRFDRYLLKRRYPERMCMQETALILK